MTKVAINGMGRIGRAALKIVMDRPELELVAVNDLMDLDNLAYLLNYDTVYGVYKHRVAISGDTLVVNGKSIKFLSVKDPAQLPWKDL
ncbi:MAG: glyceraldehyde 3-phosphate dehydrogenase NAD-binding domain-containing protein, partial [Deltaproteobacteria bacterium]|nr:glyceraldehyde 3-phosphate dehydrogenase NAD-binding domain-containing protein [Deltaproteobacteria bacterium]